MQQLVDITAISQFNHLIKQLLGCQYGFWHFGINTIAAHLYQPCVSNVSIAGNFSKCLEIKGIESILN